MSIKYTFKAPSSGYSLGNPPTDCWFEQVSKDAETTYLGVLSRCGVYIVRIGPNGVFITMADGLSDMTHVPVVPITVSIVKE
jgi:hypothetical protein